MSRARRPIGSPRDNLRFRAAVTATELAFSKWARLAWGIDKADSEGVQNFARILWEEMQSALDRARERARP